MVSIRFDNEKSQIYAISRRILGSCDHGPINLETIVLNQYLGPHPWFHDAVQEMIDSSASILNTERKWNLKNTENLDKNEQMKNNC